MNNKDLLKEIHRSKNTYCSFIDRDAADYDIIIHDVATVSPEIVAIARQNRAERLARLQQDEAAARGEKRRIEEFQMPVESIPIGEVVIRVMTWEHVPVNDVATKRAQAELTDEDENIYIEYDENEPKVSPNAIRYVKCNFPPFQHFRVDNQGSPYCVGKSHWQGDLVSGKWSRDHGTMTRTLAMMFMKLCERYATRSNWRGYTYNDEMRSQALLQLSQIGLQFDESKSQNPFAYFTAAITNSFTRVLNIEKRNQNLRDDILEMNGFSPSYTRQGMNVGYSHDGDHD